MTEHAASDSSSDLSFELATDRQALEAAREAIVDAIKASGCDDSCAFAIRLALEEALANAYKHGNREDPEKTIRLTCRIDQANVVLTVEDEGAGFDPKAVPDPTANENLEIPSGRGLVLMRAYMTDVSFEKCGRLVSMRYRRQP